LSELVRDLQNAPACGPASHYTPGSEPGESCPARDLSVSVQDDGLLVSRAPGRATTWMNARPNDHAVTPRAGAAVEVNALWYNAICVVRDLATKLGRDRWVTEMTALASRVQESFNRVFWNASQGCCYDVVDGTTTDPSIRPNQLLSISLAHPVLERSRWNSVIDVVVKRLLTPRGVRTLSTDDPAYRGRYMGDIVKRDHALHQGSAFVWWLGPLVSAYVRAQHRSIDARKTARRWIVPCLDYLQDEGVGQLPELFDGDVPHHPGGSIADARGIGELLRCCTQDLADRAMTTVEPVPTLSPTSSVEQLVRK
jgi:glycogen debranching enzyme